MKNSRKIVFALCTVIPFIIWLIYYLSSVGFTVAENNFLLGFAFGIYAAINVFWFLFGVIKYRGEVGTMNENGALIALITNSAALIFILIALYPAGIPANPSLSAFTLALGSIAVLYWATLLASKKESMTGKTLIKQLLFCAGIPLIVAICLNAGNNALNTALMSIGAAILTAALCFTLIYLFSTLKSPKDKTGMISSVYKDGKFYKLYSNGAVVLILGVIAPQLGLWVNLGCGNILGNYSSPAFFAVILLNGILMLPAVKSKFISLPYLYLKCIGFSLVIYFTIVFMPALPLGFFAIILVGLGLLTFVPLLLCVIESGQIYFDVQALKSKWRTSAIALTIIGGLITFPALFCAGAAFDRQNLKNALTYTDPYDQSYPAVNNRRLLNTVNRRSVVHAEGFFEDFADILYEDITPFYDNIYNEIVFNGGALSSRTANRLNAVFDPDFNGRLYNDTLINTHGDAHVDLAAADTRTYYNDSISAYVSQVNLVLKNNSGSDEREFSDTFYIPDGAIISDFYLDIGGDRRKGLITDKRAAIFTYDSEVYHVLDPGIIYYKDKNHIELNVYPFGANEVRKCGFTVIHSNPGQIEIDGKTINLDTGSAPEITEFGGGALIPAQKLETYPKTERKPYYCFVIDASENAPTEDYIERAEDYIKSKNITDGAVYFASEKVVKIPIGQLENVKIINNLIYTGGSVTTKSGGYNLAGGFGAAQTDVLNNHDGYFPALIAVTGDIERSALPDESGFLPEFPENIYWYMPNNYGGLTAYTIKDNVKIDRDSDSGVFSQPVVITPYGIAADTGETQIVYNGEIKTDDNNLYTEALALYSRSVKNPYDLANIRDSIKMNILCPSTAFSVFEYESQVKNLLETQKHILEGENVEQTEAEDALSMDEGENILFISTAAIAITVAVLSKRRKKRQIYKK